MIRYLSLGILVFTTISTSFSANDTNILLPIPPHVDVGEKLFYIETFFTANWYRAAQFCRYHNLHLASIKNQEENDRLVEQLTNFGLNTESFWISGNDLAQAKSFIWGSNGEDFTYENWQDRQPDGRVWPEEVEHCVEINDVDSTGIKWNDARCSLEAHFICEN